MEFALPTKLPSLLLPGAGVAGGAALGAGVAGAAILPIPGGA